MLQKTVINKTFDTIANRLMISHSVSLTYIICTMAHWLITLKGNSYYICTFKNSTLKANSCNLLKAWKHQFNQPHFIAEFSPTNIIMLIWNYNNIPSPSTSASLPSDRLLWTRCIIECKICKLNWVNWCGGMLTFRRVKREIF